MKNFNDTDTICALATGGGMSAIALIRISGIDAIKISDKIKLTGLSTVREACQNMVYFREFAKAIPNWALELCAPDQNGTAISAKSFCDCQTSAKNALFADSLSRRAFAACM